MSVKRRTLINSPGITCRATSRSYLLLRPDIHQPIVPKRRLLAPANALNHHAAEAALFHARIAKGSERIHSLEVWQLG
jgi:hypothetical protein